MYFFHVFVFVCIRVYITVSGGTVVKENIFIGTSCLKCC